MAFVHPQSCECIKSELDIFAVPPTQTSIEHGQYVEYNPIAAIALGQPIEFNISGGGQDYLDLANTQLYVKAQILRQNGNPLQDADDVGPVNLFLHSAVFRSGHFSERYADYLVQQYLPVSRLFGNSSQLRTGCQSVPTIVVDVLQRHGRIDGRNRGRCRRCSE